jgi:hypothetical protein
LLEDYPEILAAAQEATSNLLPTKINRLKKCVTALLMSKVLLTSKMLLTSKVALFFIDFYLVK